MSLKIVSFDSAAKAAAVQPRSLFRVSGQDGPATPFRLEIDIFAQLAPWMKQTDVDFSFAQLNTNVGALIKDPKTHETQIRGAVQKIESAIQAALQSDRTLNVTSGNLLNALKLAFNSGAGTGRAVVCLSGLLNELNVGPFQVLTTKLADANHSDSGWACRQYVLMVLFAVHLKTLLQNLVEGRSLEVDDDYIQQVTTETKTLLFGEQSSWNTSIPAFLSNRHARYQADFVTPKSKLKPPPLSGHNDFDGRFAYRILNGVSSMILPAEVKVSELVDYYLPESDAHSYILSGISREVKGLKTAEVEAFKGEAKSRVTLYGERFADQITAALDAIRSGGNADSVAPEVVHVLKHMVAGRRQSRRSGLGVESRPSSRDGQRAESAVSPEAQGGLTRSTRSTSTTGLGATLDPTAARVLSSLAEHPGESGRRSAGPPGREPVGPPVPPSKTVEIEFPFVSLRTLRNLAGMNDPANVMSASAGVHVPVESEERKRVRELIAELEALIQEQEKFESHSAEFQVKGREIHRVVNRAIEAVAAAKRADATRGVVRADGVSHADTESDLTTTEGVAALLLVEEVRHRSQQSSPVRASASGTVSMGSDDLRRSSFGTNGRPSEPVSIALTHGAEAVVNDMRSADGNHASTASSLRHGPATPVPTVASSSRRALGGTPAMGAASPAGFARREKDKFLKEKREWETLRARIAKIAEQVEQLDANKHRTLKRQYQQGAAENITEADGFLAQFGETDDATAAAWWKAQSTSVATRKFALKPWATDAEAALKKAQGTSAATSSPAATGRLAASSSATPGSAERSGASRGAASSVFAKRNGSASSLQVASPVSLASSPSSESSEGRVASAPAADSATRKAGPPVAERPKSGSSVVPSLGGSISGPPAQVDGSTHHSSLASAATIDTSAEQGARSATSGAAAVNAPRTDVVPTGAEGLAESESLRASLHRVNSEVAKLKQERDQLIGLGVANLPAITIDDEAAITTRSAQFNSGTSAAHPQPALSADEVAQLQALVNRGQVAVLRQAYELKATAATQILAQFNHSVTERDAAVHRTQTDRLRAIVDEAQQSRTEVDRQPAGEGFEARAKAASDFNELKRLNHELFTNNGLRTTDVTSSDKIKVSDLITALQALVSSSADDAQQKWGQAQLKALRVDATPPHDDAGSWTFGDQSSSIRKRGDIGIFQGIEPTDRPSGEITSLLGQVRAKQTVVKVKGAAGAARGSRADSSRSRHGESKGGPASGVVPVGSRAATGRSGTEVSARMAALPQPRGLVKKGDGADDSAAGSAGSAGSATAGLEAVRAESDLADGGALGLVEAKHEEVVLDSPGGGVALSSVSPTGKHQATLITAVDGPDSNERSAAAPAPISRPVEGARGDTDVPLPPATPYSPFALGSRPSSSSSLRAGGAVVSPTGSAASSAGSASSRRADSEGERSPLASGTSAGVSARRADSSGSEEGDASARTATSSSIAAVIPSSAVRSTQNAGATARVTGSEGVVPLRATVSMPAASIPSAATLSGPAAAVAHDPLAGRERGEDADNHRDAASSSATTTLGASAPMVAHRVDDGGRDSSAIAGLAPGALPTRATLASGVDGAGPAVLNSRGAIAGDAHEGPPAGTATFGSTSAGGQSSVIIRTQPPLATASTSAPAGSRPLRATVSSTAASSHPSDDAGAGPHREDGVYRDPSGLIDATGRSSTSRPTRSLSTPGPRGGDGAVSTGASAVTRRATVSSRAGAAVRPLSETHLSPAGESGGVASPSRPAPGFPANLDEARRRMSLPPNDTFLLRRVEPPAGHRATFDGALGGASSTATPLLGSGPLFNPSSVTAATTTIRTSSSRAVARSSSSASASAAASAVAPLSNLALFNQFKENADAFRQQLREFRGKSKLDLEVALGNCFVEAQRFIQQARAAANIETDVAAPITSAHIRQLERVFKSDADRWYLILANSWYVNHLKKNELLSKQGGMQSNHINILYLEEACLDAVRTDHPHHNPDSHYALMRSHHYLKSLADFDRQSIAANAWLLQNYPDSAYARQLAERIIKAFDWLNRIKDGQKGSSIALDSDADVNAKLMYYRFESILHHIELLRQISGDSELAVRIFGDGCATYLTDTFEQKFKETLLIPTATAAGFYRAAEH